MCKAALLHLISVTVFNISHYTPSHTLHSASDTLSLQIPHTKDSTVGCCTFSVFGPSTSVHGKALPFLSTRNPGLFGFIQVFEKMVALLIKALSFIIISFAHNIQFQPLKWSNCPGTKTSAKTKYKVTLNIKLLVTKTQWQTGHASHRYSICLCPTSKMRTLTGLLNQAQMATAVLHVILSFHTSKQN